MGNVDIHLEKCYNLKEKHNLFLLKKLSMNRQNIKTSTVDKLHSLMEGHLHLSLEYFRSSPINASILLLLNSPVLHYCLILNLSLCSQLIQLPRRIETSGECIILPTLSVSTPKLLPIAGKGVVLQYGSPKFKPWDILHPGNASFTI